MIIVLKTVLTKAKSKQSDLPLSQQPMLYSAGRSTRAAAGAVTVSAAARPGGRNGAKLAAAAAPGTASPVTPVTKPPASLMTSPSSRHASQLSCVASTEGSSPPQSASGSSGTSGPYKPCYVHT